MDKDYILVDWGEENRVTELAARNVCGDSKMVVGLAVFLVISFSQEVQGAFQVH